LASAAVYWEKKFAVTGITSLMPIPLSRYFEFKSFFSELEFGLGIPLTPIYLAQKNTEDPCCVSIADEFSLTEFL
jgi:hypothetical protein